MSRRITVVCTYLVLLMATLFLLHKHLEVRALDARLRENLDISLQEKEQIRSQMSLLQEQFDELASAHDSRILKLEQEDKKRLGEEMEVLRRQLKGKEEADKVLLAQLQSTQQALEETQKLEVAAPAPQKQEIVSTIEEAARKQRVAELEESRRKQEEERRQANLRLVNSLRERAEESPDERERERLSHAAEIFEQCFDLFSELSNAPDEAQRQVIQQELDEFRSPFRELAGEQIKADLARLGARFNVPPERIEEFVDATYRVIGDPTKGGSTLFTVSTGVFSFPE